MKCFLCGLMLFIHLWSLVSARTYEISLGISDEQWAQSFNNPVYFRVRGGKGSVWFVKDNFFKKRNVVETWQEELEDVGNVWAIIVLIKKGFKFVPQSIGVDGKFMDWGKPIALRTYADKGCSYVNTNLNRPKFWDSSANSKYGNAVCKFDVEYYEFYIKLHTTSLSTTVDPLYFAVEGEDGMTSFYLKDGFTTAGQEYPFQAVLEDVGTPEKLIILTQFTDSVRIAAAGLNGNNIEFSNPDYYAISYGAGTTGLGCSWLEVPLNGGDPQKKSWANRCPFAGTEGLTLIGPTPSPTDAPTDVPSTAPTSRPTMAPTTELQGFEALTRTYSFTAQISTQDWSQSTDPIRFAIYGDKNEWSEPIEKQIFSTKGATVSWEATVTNVGMPQKVAIWNNYKDGVRFKQIQVNGGDFVDIDGLLIVNPWWEEDPWSSGCSFVVIDLTSDPPQVEDGTTQYRDQFIYCPYPFMVPDTIAPSPAPTIASSSCNGANYRTVKQNGVAYFVMEAEATSNNLDDISFVYSPESTNWKEGSEGTTNYVYWNGDAMYYYGGQYQLSAKIKIRHAGSYIFKWRTKSAATGPSDLENDFWVRFSDASDYYAMSGNTVRCAVPEFRSELPCLGSGDERYDMWRYQGWFKVFKNVNEFGTGEDWTWTTRVESSNHWFGDLVAVFDTTGTYTIELSARSPRLWLDKIAMFRFADKTITDAELENLGTTKCS